MVRARWFNIHISLCTLCHVATERTTTTNINNVPSGSRMPQLRIVNPLVVVRSFVHGYSSPYFNSFNFAVLLVVVFLVIVCLAVVLLLPYT